MAEDLRPGDPEWAGPYRLLGRLGAGGMGQVYLARSPGGRQVAVKVIRTELAADPGFRARFAREAAAARTVSGIFTAPVIDADTEAPQPWLATAYIPGPSLAQAVATGGPLPPDMVATLGAGLAEGLQAIHAAGLVHRDLKPSNVLLADDGPRVIDFGIARALDDSTLTQTGTIMGSPGFLSPEQATGHPVGPPGDVFSLGSVLAFAASGEGPFGQGMVAPLVYRVVNAEPNLSGVPAQLRPLIERCLAKDPACRPTAGELLAWLGARPQSPQWRPETAFPAARPGMTGPPGGAEPPTAPTRTHLAAGRNTAGYGPAGCRPGGRGRGTRRALVAGVVAVIAAVSAGIALAAGDGGHASARPPAATGKATVKAPPSASARRTAPASAAVAGVWTGTYTCNQGLTGIRLTITRAGGSALRAVAAFYPVAGNPGTGRGSYELSGSYSAGAGLTLTPVYWISEPSGYVMVSLSAPPPSGTSMQGTIRGPNCTTFSLTR